MALLFLSPSACTRGERPSSSPKGPSAALVFASFQPLADWARRIGGSRIELRSVCAAHEDPATCSPTPETIARMQRADLVLVNGAGFEKWTDVVSLSPSRLVDTSAGFTDEFLHHQTAIEHQHGPLGAKHTHGGLDGHIWLDPNLAKKQAQAILDRFVTSWPDDAVGFRARATELFADLEKLHQRHLALIAQRGRPNLLASHPAYDYLGRRYGWQLVNLDIDPEAPLPAEVRPTLEAARASQTAPVILFESTPIPALEEELRTKLGLRVVLFSPAERPSTEGDYVSIMNQNLDRLSAALSGGPSP